MSASAMWWISVLVFLFWCYSWVLAYRVKKLLFWAFWNTVMGFVLWMSLFALAAGSPWLLFLWYCSLLAIPCYWMVQDIRGGSEPPPPADDYSDLRPLTDEHGHARGPR